MISIAGSLSVWRSAQITTKKKRDTMPTPSNKFFTRIIPLLHDIVDCLSIFATDTTDTIAKEPLRYTGADRPLLSPNAPTSPGNPLFRTSHDPMLVPYLPKCSECRDKIQPTDHRFSTITGKNPITAKDIWRNRQFACATADDKKNSTTYQNYLAEKEDEAKAMSANISN